MTLDRRRQIEALFDEALDRPADARAAFLDEACADDPDLRAAVQRLLDAYADAPSFLEGDAADVGQAWAAEEEAAHDRRGEIIGPYRLHERIGQGGMSVVYRAERTDGAFDQTVALKLLPAHFETEQRVARFRAERQILARLTHPHIARLLDGGMTTEGHPYLAMEYVEGQPLTVHAREANLSIEERLALLCDVLGALQYAHQNLIVHRDIKPDNILVTPEGTVKLLDFGIAKLLDQTDVPFTLPLTRTGQRLMTPEYAAPEQVTGGTVTTATDVYQVGVLAYELLTGVRPFDLQGKTPSQIERIVAEQPPERPSTAWTAAATAQATVPDGDSTPAPPAAVGRRLAGDLDTIILKALAKEPDQRYASVEAFADDLQRFAEGRPVQARTPTLRYRAKKFVQRNRGPVTAAALGALLILGFGAALLNQRNVALEERDRYQQELATSEAVTDYLTELFAASNPRETRGDTLTAYELLDAGVDRIGELAAEPRVQHRLMRTMALSYREMGAYDQADTLLTQTIEQIAETSGPRSAATANAMADLASLRTSQGDLPAADSLYRAAVALQAETLPPDDPTYAQTLNGWAVVLARQGDLEEAEAHYREALAIRQRVHGPHHERVAATKRNLAILIGQQDRLDEAIDLLEDALAVERDVLGDNHLQVAATASSLAAAHTQNGEPERGLPLLEEALAIKVQTLGEAHDDLLPTLNNLAVVTERLGDYAAADSLYQRTLDLARQHFGTYHPAVAVTTSNRGTLARRQGDYAQALQQYQEALRIQRELYDGPHPAIAENLHNAGQAYHGLGETEAAEAHLLQALEHAKTVLGEDNPRMGLYFRALHAFYLEQGDSLAAGPYAARLNE
ncbi:MAG: tetratricopeptide repeat protein [Bacteroidetes bacterium]|jgi:serine/threonine-protein kinase|nr:tetratricopeptide repeat protein [Bacteroidota bacterium]